MTEDDLEKTSDLAVQWKMKFNPHPTKQTKEMIFSRIKTVSIHQDVHLNNNPLNLVATHKHLGVILASKLSYEHHLQSVFNKTMWSFEKTSSYSSKKSL